MLDTHALHIVLVCSHKVLYAFGMVCMAKYKLEVKTVSMINVLPYVFHVAIGQTVAFARFRTGRF